jgi:acyl-CoA dehydrogenase
MKSIVDEQLLMASATSEAGIGGDLRNSVCAVQPNEDGTFSLEKAATVISYGRFADGIFATARRHPNAVSSDQVLVVILKHQYTLDTVGTWDTMGMRGTRSEGHILRVTAPTHQILPAPFAEIAAQSMLAASHVFWASLWYGLSYSAVMKAQAFVRNATKKSPTKTKPVGAMRLAEATTLLQQMRSLVVDSVQRLDVARNDEAELNSVGFLVAMNNLKVGASRLALQLTGVSMEICGISGFRNDTPYSVGRHFRDAMSGSLMIANDRILDNVSNMLIVHKIDGSLLS